MLKNIAFAALVILMFSVLTVQIVQIIGGRKATVQPYNYLLYRQDVNGEARYWARNGQTGRIEISNTDPVTVIEYALERIPTNSKIVFAPGGWYLERPLVIKGKLNGDPATEDMGLQEVTIDASQVEFVMSFEETANDFITIDTFHGSSISIGQIAAKVLDGYAVLRITPTLPSQHSRAIGVFWSKISVGIIQGTGTGAGVMLGGSSGKGSVTYNQMEIGDIGGFLNNLVVEPPGDHQVYGNEIKIMRNLTIPGGVGIQDGTGPVGRHALYNNRYVTGVSSTGGVGLSIYGSDSQYSLSVTEGDAGKIVVLELGASYNVIDGNYSLSEIGFTDKSGNKTNRFAGWQP